MEMVTLVFQVLSAAAILVAAVVFYRGVIESKKTIEVDVRFDQPELDQQMLRAQIELVMREAVAVFRSQVKELAQQNAELSQIGVWADQLDSVDLTKLSDDVAMRVRALRIKKAEAAIIEAEAALAVIRKEVRFYVEKHASEPYPYRADKVKHVKDQELFAIRYLNEAQARLNTLIAEARLQERKVV